MELDNRLSTQDFFFQNLALRLKSPFEKRKVSGGCFSPAPNSSEGSCHFLFSLLCWRKPAAPPHSPCLDPTWSHSFLHPSTCQAGKGLLFHSLLQNEVDWLDSSPFSKSQQKQRRSSPQRSSSSLYFLLECHSKHCWGGWGRRGTTLTFSAW